MATPTGCAQVQDEPGSHLTGGPQAASASRVSRSRLTHMEVSVLHTVPVLARAEYMAVKNSGARSVQAVRAWADRGWMYLGDRHITPRTCRSFGGASSRTGHASFDPRKDWIHVTQNCVAVPRPGGYLPGAQKSLTRELPELARTFAEVDAVASAAGLASVHVRAALRDHEAAERRSKEFGVIQARSARKADIHELSHVLSRAFYDDPLTMWMLPDAKSRSAHLPRAFATLTRNHHLAGGGVEVACDGPIVGAAALWDPPNRWQQTPREQLAMAPSLIRAFGFRLALVRGAIELMKSHHPEGGWLGRGLAR